MQKFPKDWDIVTQISFLQRKIILCSISYYDMNESPISDKEYDELSKQLVALQKSEKAKNSQYWYVFHDFDGTTGFDIRDRLTEKDNEYLSHLTLAYKRGRYITIKGEKPTTLVVGWIAH